MCFPLRTYLLIFLLYFPLLLFGQDNSLLRSVQMFATVGESPAFIKLEWINDGSGSSYEIYRRTAYSGSGWGNPIHTSGSSESSFTDNNVGAGTLYEYRIIKQGSTDGYGYMVSGIKTNLKAWKGILIMVVEDSYLGDSEFSAAVDQTVSDIEMDGWKVERINVNKSDNVSSVKQRISEIYNRDAANTKALYLIGHVPVPYSGRINPDGHPNHRGAWPADVYYGNFSTGWTDNQVYEIASGAPERIWNVPGDGKYDQSSLPSDVQLQIGRIDFVRQYLFNKSEKNMLIEYLNKAHRYKTAQFTVADRALIDDNFTSRSEGFASSGYRNFAPMFGRNASNPTADFVDGTKTNGGGSYMWAYGCGGGSYQSCSGVASTLDFAQNNLQIVFSMLFGSYFGDWDSDNNLLRAAIAQGHTLTTAWSARPHWFFHHMAMGDNVGYGAWVTQNNNGEYFSGTRSSYNRMIHIALMGDPSLRMHYPSLPSELQISESNSTAVLNWKAPQDEDILGYHVYRKEENEHKFNRINPELVTTVSYVDDEVKSGGKTSYMVRSVKLQTTASGSYFNESLGVYGEVFIPVGITDDIEYDITVFPNPSSGQYTLTWSPSFREKINISLFSTDGRMVYSAEVRDTTVRKHEFDLSLWPKGIYILRLTRDNEIITSREIIKY